MACVMLQGENMLKSIFIQIMDTKLQGICTGGLDLNKNNFFGVNSFIVTISIFSEGVFKNLVLTPPPTIKLG